VTSDEASYLFQARIFLKGKLYIESHPLRKFFDAKMVVNNGRWYGKYPPGHSFFLMIGLFIGNVRYLLTLVSGSSLILIYFISKSLFDRNVARLTTVFALFSLYFIFTSSTYFSQITSLFFLLSFIYTILRAKKYDNWHLWPLSGILWGIAFNIRPYTAVAISIPFVCYAILPQIKNFKFLKQGCLFLMGAIPLLGIYLAYNHFLTGNMFLSPYKVYCKYEDIGFGMHGCTDDLKPLNYTPYQGILNLITNLFNLVIWICNCPPLLLFSIATLLFLPKHKGDWLCLCAFSSIPTFYFFYFHPGVNYFGPSYYYEGFPFLLMFTVRGILFSIKSLKEIPSSISLFFIMCTFFLATIFFFVDRFQHYDEYTTILSEPVRLSKDRKNALVFFADHPRSMLNTPDIEKQDVIYALNLGNESIKLINYYSDRECYIYSNSTHELLPCNISLLRTQ
jgi:4-amino-4-deoxy-L-arabinose transferase-like glycosyltransferase